MRNLNLSDLTFTDSEGKVRSLHRIFFLVVVGLAIVTWPSVKAVLADSYHRELQHQQRVVETWGSPSAEMAEW